MKKPIFYCISSLLVVVAIIFPTIVTLAIEDKTNNITINNNNNKNSSNLSSISTSSAISSDAINYDDVDFATNIEFIKGHISAAISNKKAGNNELTETHTFHPIHEIYTLIRDRLASADTNLNQTIINSLNNLTLIVFTSTPTEFVDSASSVKQLLDNAIIKVIPKNEISDIKFNMRILINLLKTAESEYDVGVDNGTITNIAEYQHAQGFTTSANELLNKTIHSSKNQTLTNKFTTEIKDSLEQLNASISNKDDPKQISTLVNKIANNIPTILNVQPKDLAILVSIEEGEKDSSKTINTIRNLLDESIKNIKNNSDYQIAETLIVDAYLNNFEFLEPDIAKHDESLMKDTEVLLREQLRHLIQTKSPIEDIQKMVDNINIKLNQIEQLLKTE